VRPLERIEALKAKAATFDSPDAAACTLFDEAMALASELAAESEWRSVSEEPPSAGWYIVASAHGFVYESHWSGTRWRDRELTTTHWRPMPRGPER
jgi:hypothetical protein